MEQLLLNVALCIDILCQCSELANNIIVLLGQSHGTVLGLRFIVFHLWCPYFLCVNYGIVVIYLVLFVSKLMLPDFSYNYPSSSSSSPFYFQSFFNVTHLPNIIYLSKLKRFQQSFIIKNLFLFVVFMN